MTPQSAPAERLFNLKDSQWATQVLENDGNQAEQFLQMAWTSAKELAKQDPQEREIVRVLAEGRNLPAVRVEFEGRNVQFRSGETYESREAFARQVQAQYPHDMRGLKHIQLGYLHEAQGREREFFDANAGAAMKLMRASTKSVHARLMAKAVLEAQDQGDDKISSALVIGASSSDPSSLTVPSAVVRNSADKEIIAEALKVREATNRYRTFGGAPIDDVVKHLSDARNAFAVLQQNVVQLDASLRESPSAAMTRGSAEHVVKPGSVGDRPEGLEATQRTLGS